LVCYVTSLEVGVDEAGRGPVIGPLVVCALGIPETDRGILKEIGADDSKKMTKEKRVEIYGKIVELSLKRDWKISKVVCDPERIDETLPSENLNSLEVKLFSEAIKGSCKSSDCKVILLDACDVNAVRFGNGVSRELGRNWSDCEIVSDHGMDGKDVIVGAASIVAKVIRDSEMEMISSEIGIDCGSGYPSDPKTKIAVVELCRGENPHGCLRWSWSTTKVAWENIHQLPIPERSSKGRIHSQFTLDQWKQ